MKNKPTLLQISDLTTDNNKRLRELFNVVSSSQISNHQNEIIALVTTGGVPVDSTLIYSLPALKVIVTRGIGVDHIDLEAAFKKDILVSNTPDILTDCVADLAFGGLISISRQILEADTFVRSGQWINNKFPMSTKVSGKKIGIVGFGRIGQAIAIRAQAFNMQIKYFSRSKKNISIGVYEPSLLNLARWADYLIICAPGGKSTENMISLEILETLGKNGFLINVARGSLINENSLLKVIREQKIAGAVLDVFLEEPEVPEELIHSKKVILLPHIASRTQETFLEIEELLLQNLQNYFASGTLLTPVEKG